MELHIPELSQIEMTKSQAAKQRGREHEEAKER
jgi:hypothetical protein